MLERTGACLEAGSFRRLLPHSKKTLTSRRSLHSGFWYHGASELELSPLWALLLRSAQPDGNENTTQHNGSGGSGSCILDFLYPSGTINFLHSAWGFERQDNRRLRAVGRVGHRLYTNSSKDASSQQRSIEQDQESNNTRAVDNEAGVVALKCLMESTEPPHHEEIWNHYLKLSSHGRKLLRHSIIQFLSTSPRILDAERITHLFDQLQQSDTNLETYNTVMRSFLRLRDYPRAMKLHQTALANCEQPACSGELLAYLVENSLFEESFRVWSHLQSHKTQYSSRNHRLYKDLKEIPNLRARVSELIEYVNASSGLAEEFTTYAAQVIRTALLDAQEFDEEMFSACLNALQSWKVDTPIIYQDALQSLSRIGNTRLAVQTYRKARLLPNINFTQSTLHTLLEIFCKSGIIIGMQEVIDDFFRFHGKLSRTAYKMTSTYFASRGDAATVHTLFQQYTSRFPIKGGHSDTSDVLAPILTVHAKRGELAEVVKYFKQIEEVYKMKPTILCWNILLSAYGKVQDIDAAFSKFHTILESSGVQPDDYTFGTMMGICTVHGDRNSVIALWDLASQRQIKKSTAMVDCLVQVHIQDNLLAQAEKICEDAVGQTLRGSRARMWNALLVEYAIRHDLENVSRILQRMTDHGIQHDQLTYAALMQALAMSRQPGRAEMVLKEIMPEAGLKPTNFHYAIIIGAWLAVGDVQHVFRLYDHMMKQGLGKSASTRLLALKAILKQGNGYTETRTEEIRFQHATQLFEEVVSSLDPQDIAQSGTKGVGRVPLDIAYSSMFYAYFMFILARAGDTKKVGELYARYLKIIAGKHNTKPPLRILTALMATALEAEDYEGVSRLWETALAQARDHGKTLEITADHPQPRHDPSDSLQQTGDTKILYFRRFDLTRALALCMTSQERSGKVDDLSHTVEDLQTIGFALSSSNWNHYVQILARQYQWKSAFEICESKLVGGFTGWARGRQRTPGLPTRLPLALRRLGKQPGHLRPTSRTILFLARAFLELQGALESKSNEDLLEHLEKSCPHTLQAIKTMIRLNDAQEREILHMM